MPMTMPPALLMLLYSRRAGQQLRLLACMSAQQSQQLPQQQQWVLGGIHRMAAWLPGTLIGDEGFYARLAVQKPFDWNGVTKDGRQVSKIFFVSWVPDTCKAKTKMLYASSKQALRNALDGVQLDHQATDYDEITPEELNERAGL